MDDKRVADYFLISGISDSDPQSLVEIAPLIESPLPITEITVIFKAAGEVTPSGFTCLDKTPSGFPADLNSGNFKSQNIFLCYKRGNDKPPIVDVGILYENKERALTGTEVLRKTAFDRCASLSGSSKYGTYITYRRAKSRYPYNQPVVVDLSVIFNEKSESPPPAFHVIRKNLNTNVFYGMIGSEVLLCYKKTIYSPRSLCFKPQVLSRFPLQDYSKLPLNEKVTLFCLPTGANVERWPVDIRVTLPQSSSFVLTSDSAQKIYGSVLSFYEPFDENALNEDQKSRIGLNELTKSGEPIQFKLYATKAICLLSQWPFFECFDKFLFFLHRLVFKENIIKPGNSRDSSPKTVAHVQQIDQVSLEHYISHFLLDVSFPTPQRPKVLVQLLPGSDEEVQITQPSSNLPLPQTGASFFLLLKTLGVENSMNVLLFGLSEQKILLHTLIPSLLTGIAEAIVALLFPLQWQFPYVPVCPPSLKVNNEMWGASFPFIVGIDARSFEKFTPPDDIICIDLDAKSILMSETKRCLNLKALPKRAARVLKSSLDKIYQDIIKLQQLNYQSPQNSKRYDIAMQQAKKKIELQAREAFIRFMATILKDFRHYLLPITKAPTIGATDPHSLFNFEGFLMSRDRSYSQFYQWITKTQMFTHYIEERSFVSDKDTSLAFFDDCEERLANSINIFSDKPLNLFDKHDALAQEDRSVFIPAPELSPISSKSFNSTTVVNENLVDTSTTRFGPLDVSKFHRHPNQPDLIPLLDLEWSSDQSNSADKVNQLVTEYQFNSNQQNSIASIINSSSLLISRRTKQEIKVCQKQAKKSISSPNLWAKHLLNCCYSIWFVVLPSYISYCRKNQISTTSSNSKETDRILRVAYSTILKMKSLYLITDEICYRVLTLLCGQYGQPALAVRVYFEMKKSGIVPNAVTYGYYNKSVLESSWPEQLKKAEVLWAKLRNVSRGIALFKNHGLIARQRKNRIQRSNLILTRNSTDTTDFVKENLIPAHQFVAHEFYFPASTTTTTATAINEEKPKKVRNKPINRSLSQHSKTIRQLERDGVDELNEQHSGVRQSSIQKSKSMHLRDNSLDRSRPRITRIGSLDKTACQSSSNDDENDYDDDDDDDEEDDDEYFNYNNRNSIKLGLNTTSKANKFSNEERVKLFNLELKKRQLLVSENEDYNKQMTIEKLSLMIDSQAGDIILNNEFYDRVKLAEKGTLKSARKSLHIETLKADSEELDIGTPPKEYVINIIGKTGICKKNSNDILDANKLAGDANIMKKLEDVAKSDEEIVVVKSMDENNVVNSHECCSPSLPEKKACESKAKNDDENDEEEEDNASHSTSYSESDSDQDSVSASSSSTSTACSSNEESKQTQMTPNFKLSSLINDSNWSKWTAPHNSSVYKGIKSAASGFVSSIQDIKSSFSNTNTPARSNITTDNRGNVTKEVLSQFATYFNYKTNDSDKDELSSNDSNDIFRLSTSEDIEHSSRVIEESFKRSKMFDEFEEHYKCSRKLINDIQLEQLNELNPDFNPDMISALNITLTSCSKCNVCNSLLYDEEIMEHWSHNDSNLNTRCIYCRAAIVPILTIDVKDNRIFEKSKVKESELDLSLCNNENNNEIVGLSDVTSTTSEQQQALTASTTTSASTSTLTNKSSSLDISSTKDNEEIDSSILLSASSASSASTLQTFSIPYLSPIVLWKELENVFESTGDTCASSSQFVDEHPIIYWNLLWYFERVKLPTHLPSLCLSSKTILNGRKLIKTNFNGLNASNVLESKVSVITLWDNEKLHTDNGKPLYRLWQRCEPSKEVQLIVCDKIHFKRSLLETVLALIKANDITKAMIVVLNERLSSSARFSFDKNRHNLYRDLLFLTTVAAARNMKLCSENFEREYRKSFNALNFKHVALNRFDKSPSLGSLFCRSLFDKLELS